MVQAAVGLPPFPCVLWGSGYEIFFPLDAPVPFSVRRPGPRRLLSSYPTHTEATSTSFPTWLASSLGCFSLLFFPLCQNIWLRRDFLSFTFFVATRVRMWPVFPYSFPSQRDDYTIHFSTEVVSTPGDAGGGEEPSFALVPSFPLSSFSFLGRSRLFTLRRF